MSMFKRLYVNSLKIDLSVYTLDQSAYPSKRSEISNSFKLAAGVELHGASLNCQKPCLSPYIA